MTNFEKYKTAEERTEAFDKMCDGFQNGCEGCVLENRYESCDCKFAWLELEAAEEKPLPCPFCCNPTYVSTIIGFKHVSCSYCGMNAPIHSHTKESDAIAEYNRFARAVMAAKDKEAK